MTMFTKYSINNYHNTHLFISSLSSGHLQIQLNLLCQFIGLEGPIGSSLPSMFYCPVEPSPLAPCSVGSICDTSQMTGLATFSRIIWAMQ